MERSWTVSGDCETTQNTWTTFTAFQDEGLSFESMRKSKLSKNIRYKKGCTLVLEMIISIMTSILLGVVPLVTKELKLFSTKYRYLLGMTTSTILNSVGLFSVSATLNCHNGVRDNKENCGQTFVIYCTNWSRWEILWIGYWRLQRYLVNCMESATRKDQKFRRTMGW